MQPSPKTDYLYPSVIPFLGFHLAAFAALWTGITTEALLICAGVYAVGMFAIGAGYHRYFSHRAYDTSRVFQFVLAFLAQATGQKSVLWWAAKHRHHHLHSDQPDDVHSPRHHGFVYAHLGWIFTVQHDKADLGKVADLTAYPELRWLHRFELVPMAAMAGAAFLLGGWPGLVGGFVWATVLLWHATFCINSLAHVKGTRRYVTGDDSRNNWLLALMTFGEGWHNNHHAYQSSVRQGFRWWELDVSFLILRSLAVFGIVWDMKSPPAAVLRNEQRLGSKVVDRAAELVAASFPADRIAAALRDTYASAPDLAELNEMMTRARDRAVDLLSTLHHPHIPTRQEVLQRAAELLVRNSSMDDIVDRARRKLLEAVYARLAAAAPA